MLFAGHSTVLAEVVPYLFVNYYACAECPCGSKGREGGQSLCARGHMPLLDDGVDVSRVGRNEELDEA